MTAWAWLLAAAASGVAAAGIGLPAWHGSQERRRRDMNAERYLAWRGRAGPPVSNVLLPAERRRLAVAGVLALVAVFCLVGFFTYA